MLKNLLLRRCRGLMAALVLSASLSAELHAEDVVLKAGTPVPMQLMTTVTGKDAIVGQLVDFKVTQDITVDGKTVIPANSVAKAQVVRARKNGLLGREGEIQLSVNSVTAVDGTQVVLTGGTLADEGRNKLVVSWLLCFLLKGGQGELTAGLTCSPIVAGNTTISVD